MNTIPTNVAEYRKILTMKSIKKVVKTKKKNQRNLLTKTKIETIIKITRTLLLGRKIINVVKSHLNLMQTNYEITKLLRKILQSLVIP